MDIESQRDSMSSTNDYKTLEDLNDGHSQLTGDIRSILDGTRKLMSDLGSTCSWNNYIHLRRDEGEYKEQILKEIECNIDM